MRVTSHRVTVLLRRATGTAQPHHPLALQYTHSSLGTIVSLTSATYGNLKDDHTAIYEVEDLRLAHGFRRVPDDVAVPLHHPQREPPLRGGAGDGRVNHRRMRVKMPVYRM